MTGFKNINLSEYFKRYGIKNGVSRLMFIANPIHIVRDFENRKVLYYRKERKKLKKYIDKKNTVVDISFNDNYTNENTVWVYWKQGLSQAPEIVKRCVASIKENVEQPVVVLNDANVEEYLRLPKSILLSNKKGNISNAALSDLIRLSLLEHYGGTWIDATVLLTAPLSSYVTDSDFFAFQDTFGLVENPALFSSWLLHATKGNNIIRQTRDAAFAYLEREKHISEYLWIYILLTLAVEKDPASKKRIPYVNSDYSHLLFNELGNEYDSKTIRHILKLTTVHKLTYKLTDQAINDPKDVYNFILTH